mgnify:CR=1 FL=1|jgi:hypothetical protein
MNIVEVVNLLEDMISTGAASEKQIISAEQELGVLFADEYKEFLQQFGSVLADDIELVGIAKSKNRNVVDVTKREWEYNKNVPKNLYVVENIGIEGIVIWQDEKGLIYQTSLNKAPKVINKSLSEYITDK